MGEMDLTNESTMSLFQELEEVEEVKEEETTTNSSLLSNLINQCGIPLEEQQEKITNQHRLRTGFQGLGPGHQDISGRQVPQLHLGRSGKWGGVHASRPGLHPHRGGPAGRSVNHLRH